MKARRADATANQARVLAAACEVFAEYGLEAEIKDIAERAGVGVATIYRGFGNKEGLLLATAHEAMARMTAVIEEAEQNEDPIEGLRTFLIKTIAFVESFGWLFQAALRSDVFLKMKPDHESDHVDHRERMKRLIERCIEAGDIAARPDPDVVVLLLEGIVVSLSVGRGHERPRPPADKIAQTMMALLTGKVQETAPLSS